LKKEVKVALALGGGGARGLAHIGVLKILEKEQIPIDMIVGSSIGAIVGGAYAQRPDAEALQGKFESFLVSPEYKSSGLNFFRNHESKDNLLEQIAVWMKDRIVINLARRKSSLVHEKRLHHTVNFFVKDVDFEDANIPFAAVATDIENGETVILNEGKMRPAIEASSAIPGFLPPIEFKNRYLLDGAITALVPIHQAISLGADLVIGVNVAQSLENNPLPDNVLDIIFKSQLITSFRFSQYIQKDADIIITPDVGLVHWAEFMNLTKIIKSGEAAAEKMIDEINMLIASKSQSKWKKWIARLMRR